MSRFRSTILTITAAMLVIFIAGCGKEAIKPSAQNILATKAMAALADMHKAYIARDMYGVLDNVSSTYEGGYADFSSNLRKDTETYPAVELSIDIDRVELDGDYASVTFHWFGTWTNPEGNKVEGRGNSVFVFTGGEKMGLVRVTGDIPFGVVR